jgi:hypothetical protein
MTVRRGFTLLEALLAISLTSVLMVAIMASTSLYVQYRSRAIEGNRSAKILKGTLEDLRNDLRACYQGEPKTVMTLNVPTNTGVSEQVITERLLNFSSNETERAIHFVGRPNAMLLLREGQNARLVGVGQDYASDHRQIAWVAPSVRSVRLPRSRLNDRVTQHDFRVPDDQDALHRAEVVVDAAGAFPSATQRRNSDAEQWSTNEYISRMELRYFDGTQWNADWDSHLQNETVPLAVELTLALKSNPTRSLRFVIRLPGANGASIQLKSGVRLVERSGQ